MSTKVPRKFTQDHIEQVRKLSSTTKPKEIARITKIPYMTVLNIQNDPENNIVNPKRDFKYSYKTPREKKKDGYFDLEEYSKVASI